MCILHYECLWFSSLCMHISDLTHMELVLSLVVAQTIAITLVCRIVKSTKNYGLVILMNID